MKSFLEKASHNSNFLKEVESKFPKDYFDWKVVIVLYVTVHYLNAYKKMKKVAGKAEHKWFLYNCNPNNPDGLLHLNQSVYDKYVNINNSGWNSRYKGFKNKEFELALLESELNIVKADLKALQSYFRKEGLDV